MKKNLHIVPTGKGKWGVKAEGSKKSTKTFDRQKDAIEFGRQIAINNESELLIHAKDGRIRKRNSYGKDPYPPNG